MVYDMDVVRDWPTFQVNVSTSFIHTAKIKWDEMEGGPASVQVD